MDERLTKRVLFFGTIIADFFMTGCRLLTVN